MSNAKIHPCTKYALDVVEKRRVAGHLEWLACQRHLDDLKRQGEKDFPWEFDEELADRIFEWFGYCVHIEGDPELVGTPIKLAPFQKFYLGCIFGWVDKATRYRRFQKAYIQFGRKNAKSTVESGVVLYLMVGDNEQSPKVYCAAVDRQQAHVVYDIATAMAKKSPDIIKRLIVHKSKVTHITRGGALMPLSKDTKNKDAFNPSGAVVDEYHAHPTSKIYDLLASARAHRSQYLMMIITTAGEDAENSPCHKEYEYCKKILAGIIRNDRYFVFICELDENDNEHDPKVWKKANPLLAMMPAGMEVLKQEHDEAFGSGDPDKIRTFRIKRLNRWVYEAKNSYLTDDCLAHWNDHSILPVDSSTPKQRRAAFAKLTKGLMCIVGTDLSKTIDLTGDGTLFYLPDDDKIAFCAHGFLPSSAIARHEKTDRVPYRDWIVDGWVTETEGDVTDYDTVGSHIDRLEEENSWKVAELANDPWNATQFATVQQKKGRICVDVRQGTPTLSEPCKLFRAYIIQGKYVHDGSPVLRWCAANAREIRDNNGNIKLSKENKDDSQRIDLLAALINAMVRLVVLKEGAKKSIYESHGIRTL